MYSNRYSSHGDLLATPKAEEETYFDKPVPICTSQRCTSHRDKTRLRGPHIAQGVMTQVCEEDSYLCAECGYTVCWSRKAKPVGNKPKKTEKISTYRYLKG